MTTIGLEKNPTGYFPPLKIFMMGLLFVFFTLQKNLWNSSYYKSKIMDSIRGLKEKKVRRAVRFLQFYFEKKFWKYNKNKIIREIHLKRISSLDEKLNSMEIFKNEEQLSSSQSKKNLKESDFLKEDEEDNEKSSFLRKITKNFSKFYTNNYPSISVSNDRSSNMINEQNCDVYTILEENPTNSEDERNSLINDNLLIPPSLSNPANFRENNLTQSSELPSLQNKRYFLI
jgi:hypothetical protein